VDQCLFIMRIIDRIEYLETVKWWCVPIHDGAERNFTRFVYINYIANWVMQTIWNNEAISSQEIQREAASEAEIFSSLHSHDSTVY
jgi:hypothetical protein